MINVKLRDGSLQPINESKINRVIELACEGLDSAHWSEIAMSAKIDWFDGITTEEIDSSVVLAARRLTEVHPDYAYAAARLMCRVLYQDVFGPEAARNESIELLYRTRFKDYLDSGVSAGILDPRLRERFDLDVLANAIAPDRDRLFKAQGVQILQDRYLTRNRQRHIIELPQWFWMRVAMGVALAEPAHLEENGAEQKDVFWKTTQFAVSFYHTMSRLAYVPSTPTLFNSGTTHPQLSSCYVNTVEDSLEGIFKAYTDNARLSKWAGGIGTDWTQVRATGSMIKGTNGPSQGLVPWLRIDNDIAVAVNQGSKRKGAHCAYLETWHLDIEQFLELRKNVGDDRRRTHDINTANWIPDLFMQRVNDDGHWTLFSPSDVPELHDLYGQAFVKAYEDREQQYDQRLIPGKRIRAKDLWRRMLTMLFETGHPWITFKDACNLRSPQRHVGVVHNSNLCTEIVLNNSTDETAVCNIGSINIAAHITGGRINMAMLESTVRTAIRMLDNVISIGFYPTEEARRASHTHRPVGLGIMGYQDALYALNLPFGSQEHLAWADELFESISYFAIGASNSLAKDRGAYESFNGSAWDCGVFPLDTLSLVEKERKAPLDGVDRRGTRDWSALKHEVSQHGLRNSNMLAIAPTATISNIAGVSPSIEPTYKNLYVVSNLSGEFIVLNEALVREMERRGLWSQKMAEAIKAADGDLRRIGGLPDDLKEKYPEAFAIDQSWLIRAAAARGKWIDQSQSLNLYIERPSGKLMHDMYMLAWRSGLKTTYYLRSLGASQVEKSTVDTAEYGNTHRREPTADAAPKACAIDNPGCESCQ